MGIGRKKRNAENRVKWIETAMRKPTAEDADAYGCVLAYHLMQGTMIIGWHVVASGHYYTHWRRMPEPPEDAQKMQEAEDRRLRAQYGAGFLRDK